MSDKRKLTAAEQRRKEIFELRKKDLESHGYQYKPLIANIVTANIMAFVLMGPLCILITILYFIIQLGNRTNHFPSLHAK